MSKALREDLVARGIDPERRYLFVLDGWKALRAAVEKVFGERTQVQRWQGGDHIARWTAAGLLDAQKKFRKVQGYRKLKVLAENPNPGLHSQVQVA